VAAYADELALLRWNARLDQVAGLRDAIDVERQRRDHEQLRRQVLVDELTGLANRRGYRAYLNALLAPGVTPEEYAVMMVDVDHFKQVNDRFGHDVGDLVLARISEVLAAHVRPTDLAARLGGDEFVVVLAGVGPNRPETRAQEIIDAVREQLWEEVAPGLTVSISIGVHRGGVQELPTLLTDADRNLYHAKNNGRGRVAATSTHAWQ
jgi:diguanylate cyclase (GGDEF)-like protein